jgi:Flp pilus assembly protein TadD
MSELPAQLKSSPDRRPKWLAVAVGGLLAAIIVGISWAWWIARHSKIPGQPPPRAEAPDPRLTYPTPYQNVRPEVKYVGDQVCRDCHPRHFADCQQHPMGRAMAPVATAPPMERYDRGAFDPFSVEKERLHYSIERRGDRHFQREWLTNSSGKTLDEHEAEARFVIGSGTRARSYLISHDGFLFQAPATWFPQKQRWDLSPGYENKNRHFGRIIAPECLFCHCTNAEHVPETANRYREPIIKGFAIGCERCHGPGELHAKRREPGERVVGLDTTIVNPARLERPLREAICQQCHLQGEERVVARARSEFDYRPGLPLHLFLMDFVDQRFQHGEFKFVSSVEQLMASRCYRESREPKKLGCTTCHNPHKNPPAAEKVGYYRGRCLQCHTEESCSQPVAKRRELSPEDSCIVCHMPRTDSEVNHTSITDHRIMRLALKSGEPGPRHAPNPGPSDLVVFHRNLIDPDDEEASRNLGLALIAMLNRGLPDDVARQFAEKALPNLERACRRDSEDLPAAVARGEALWLLGKKEDALAELERALRARPNSEATLHLLGNVCLAADRPGEARSYLERAVRINPWRWEYRKSLAAAQLRLGERGEALREAQQGLRLDPSNTALRSLVVQSYIGLGQRDKAQTEFEVLLEQTGTNRRFDLRMWYEEQLRRLPRSSGAAGPP